GDRPHDDNRVPLYIGTAVGGAHMADEATAIEPAFERVVEESKLERAGDEPARHLHRRCGGLVIEERGEVPRHRGVADDLVQVRFELERRNLLSLGNRGMRGGHSESPSERAPAGSNWVFCHDDRATTAPLASRYSTSVR